MNSHHVLDTTFNYSYIIYILNNWHLSVQNEAEIKNIIY